MFLLTLSLALLQQSGPALADIGPAPAFKLTDQDGQPFDSARLRGRVALVSFVYTTCGGVCPATTHKLYRVQEALKQAGLWNDRVQFVSITLDPERDTSGVLKNYATTYDADTAAWHFLTGPPADIQEVIHAWGMWARRNDEGVLDHPSRIFLVDANGRQREIYSLEFLEAGSVVADIRALASEQSLTRRTRPPAPAAIRARN